MNTTTEKTATKAVLRELVYEFKSFDSKQPVSLNRNSKVVAVINDNVTEIPIEKLFMGKSSMDTSDIEGYSVLEMLKDGKIKIDANTSLEISFMDKTTGRRFYISNIRRSWAYNDDKEITPAMRMEYVDILLSSHNSHINAIEEEKRIKAENEAKIAAEQVKAEKEAKERAEREEIEANAKKIMGGPEWEVERAEIIESGLKEYQIGDYRFFYKPAQAEDDAVIAMFLLVPGEFYSIDLFEEEINDDTETYVFEDDEANEWIVTFSKKDGTLKVEEMDA